MKRRSVMVISGFLVGGGLGAVVPLARDDPARDMPPPGKARESPVVAEGSEVAELVSAIAAELGDRSDWRATLRAWRLVETMTPAQVRRAAESLLRERERRPHHGSVLRMLLERWAFLDPEQFLDRADILDRTDKTGMLGRPFQHACYHLAKRDIELAIERFKKLTSPLRVRAARDVIADALLRTDPAGFGDFARHTGSVRYQLEAQARLNAVLSDPRTTDESAGSAQALEAARQLPEGAKRWNAYGTVAAALIDEDPERAIEILDEIPAGRRRSGLLGDLGYRWAMRDSDAAVAWALTLTDPAEQTEVFKRMVRPLAGTDRELALAVIDAIPGSGKREEAFGAPWRAEFRPPEGWGPDIAALGALGPQSSPVWAGFHRNYRFRLLTFRLAGALLAALLSVALAATGSRWLSPPNSRMWLW